MKKDIEWLRCKLEYFYELDMWNWKQCEPNSKEQRHFGGCLAAIEEALGLLDQLDEPEVLSQEWIDEHAKAVAYDGVPDETEIVYVDELESLLVPKQEDVDQEQVQKYLSEHGIEVVEKEPETVADVIAVFYKSLEKLKEALSTEVKK